MTPLLLSVLFSLGLTGGFFSGLLGIGGGIILVPLLLYVPSLLGLAAVPIKTAAGITMVQSLAGAFSGLMAHRKNNFVHRSLVLYMGAASITGSLVGSVLSKQMKGDLMLGVFAGMALVATVMMLIPTKEEDEVPVDLVTFNPLLASGVGLGVGFLGGIVGQGGAFILIPLMLFVVKIPTRIALGSSVAISFLSALAGFLGKWGTGQIPFEMTSVLVAGAVLGAQAGVRLSKLLHTSSLRIILCVLIAGTALKMWVELNTTVGYLLMVGLAVTVSIVLFHRNSLENKTISSQQKNENF